MQNFSVEFKAMGSHMQAWLSAPSSHEAHILTEVPRWFETWEAALSRFRPTSELSILNAHAGEWMSVSSILFEIIEDAKDAASRSDGIFNPLILNALEAAGYHHQRLQPPDGRDAAHAYSSGQNRKTGQTRPPRRIILLTLTRICRGRPVCLPF
jgi:thiamine biosynthesis lipoprotein ApbE